MITNKRQLKEKYELLSFISEYNEGHVHDKWIKDVKKEIRAYNNIVRNTRYISGDYDGYLILIEFPANITMESAEEYFMANYYQQCLPSQYDCTGQEFTISYKLCERHGKVYCYHSVGLDV